MCYDKEPDQDADKVLQDFTNLVTALLVDLEQGLTYYNNLFERWVSLQSEIFQFAKNETEDNRFALRAWDSFWLKVYVLRGTAGTLKVFKVRDFYL